jgi:glucokinase
LQDLIASVDIGATKITVSICGREGIISRVYQRTRLEGDDSSIPCQVKDLIDLSIEKMEIPLNSISAVGVSTAGPFRKIDGTLHLISPNICGGLAPERNLLPNKWVSVPLERELGKHFGNLTIENDAVSAANAEKVFGAGREIENLLYVTWSTGIGTGAFVDGKLIKGKNGNAPHGGHVYLVDDGPMCGCGNTGHLEALASGTAIARDYGTGFTTADVFKAYHNGDQKAKDIINSAARYFARGLASLNCVLDTELIMIGGSVFLNNIDLLLPIVKEEFYRSFPALSMDVRIEPTSLGDHIGDLAALSLVIPSEWVENWKMNEPWKRAPETIML